MKQFFRPIAFIIGVTAILVCVAASAAPAPQPKEKDKAAEKDPAETLVDSGSFGVFMSGHRVGTETFSITQDRTGSIIKSEFKTENDPKGEQAVQSSELHLTPTGDIRRYDWKELSPERASSVVVPNDQFLNQKWSTGAQGKDQEQPYILPPSTSILDDYFFVHREVLAWKFLATSCKQENGQVQCPLKQRAQFGTLDPRQHSSAPLTAEYLGREKISYKGNQREFNKIELKTESGAWQLWLDDQFKVVHISIEGDNTEVSRD
ncbi:MAG: hypothetical protein WBS24_15405 [Terriglobales bacterium]